MQLFLFLGGKTERDATVQRHGVELDVEAFAVLVRPRSSDAGKIAFLIAFADLVGDVGGCLRGGGVFCIAHIRSPLFQGCLIASLWRAIRSRQIRERSGPVNRRAEGFLQESGPGRFTGMAAA